MKVAVALSLLAFAAYVIAEPCLTDADCINHGVTVCGADSHVTCDNRINQCICVTGPSSLNCTVREDCTMLTSCRDRDRHCVDQTCRCIRL